MAKSSKKSSEKPADTVDPVDSNETTSAVEATPDADPDHAQDTVDAAIAEAETVEGAASPEAQPDADTPAIDDDTLTAAEGTAEDHDPVTGNDAILSPEAEDTLATDEDVVVSASAPADAEPTVVRETVVERKAGFVPTLLGGVAAAAIGFAASQYGLFSQGDDLFRTDTEAALAAQRDRTEALSDRVDTVQGAVEQIDLAPLQGAVEGVQGQFADLDQVLAAIGLQLDTLETRLTELEKQPMSQALSPEAVAAYEREMQNLREAVAAQKAEVETLASEAIAAQNAANSQAQLAESRSALADLTARLQAGDSYADPLAVLTGNGVDVPQAVRDAAADGVPTQAALVTDFPDAARDALRAARAVETPEDGGGLGSFLQNQLGARSVVPREGDDADAVLSRAEAAVKDGNLSTALEEIAKLPAEAQDELSDWTARARLRRDALDGVATLAQNLNQQ